MMPSPASAKEKAICRLNRASCCSVNEIESIKEKFHEGVKKLNYRIELLQEILVLFRGNKYQEFLMTMMKSEEGKEYLEKTLLKD